MRNLEKGTFVLVLPWDLSHQGGVTGVVRHLKRNISDQGWLTPIVAVNSWEARVPRCVDAVWHLRFSVTGSSRIGGILKACAVLPIALWRLAKWLRAVDARVVNFHFPGLSPLGVLALRFLGLYRGRLLLSFHGTDVREPAHGLERRLLALVHQRVDALVACSVSLGDRLAETFNVQRDRVTVIYNGVDSNVFRPDAPRPEGMDTIPREFVLNVGSFIPRKDQGTLVRAFARLAVRHPNLHLLLAGADGPERGTLLEEAKGLNLGDRVSVLVDLDPAHVAYLLSICRLCVQPALAESFPLAVLEAGAAGAPVVASRIAGHDEIIEEGVSGLMFAVGDVRGCEASIQTLLADPKTALNLATNLRETVISRFTWQACGEAYQRLSTDEPATPGSSR